MSECTGIDPQLQAVLRRLEEREAENWTMRLSPRKQAEAEFQDERRQVVATNGGKDVFRFDCLPVL